MVEGRLWINIRGASTCYPIKNVKEVRLLGIKEGDELHIKGIGSFHVTRVFSLDAYGSHSEYLSLTIE